MKTFTVVVLLVFFALPVHAEIYEIIDANGRKTYTDKPPVDQKDAKPISVKPNTSNSWKTDNIQQDNDRFFSDLKSEQDHEAAMAKQHAQEQATAQQEQSNNIEAAEHALEEAKKVRAGDFYNNKEGGMHYNETYLNRVRDAQRRVEEAKKNQ